MPTTGFLVCADITGYTSYLSHSELEHASGILSDLLNLLLGEVQAPLRLSRVEGDAVISYSPGGHAFEGQTVVDRLDGTYVAFRRALEQMVLNTTCKCNACANISGLDLKFLVHHGEFVVQKLATQEELVGSQVNFLFRLTKNRIREALGMPGYTAFTESALHQLGLPEFERILVIHTEPDSERGSVNLGVRDMQPVWEDHKSRPAFVISPEDVLAEANYFLAVPVPVAWSYLTSPETRSVMFEADATLVEPSSEGRLGPGAVYVCAHGDQTVPHTIIDWMPPHRYAFTSQIPGGLKMIVEYRLSPAEGGTRVACVTAVFGGAFFRVARPIYRRVARKRADGGFARLQEVIARDALSARA